MTSLEVGRRGARARLLRTLGWIAACAWVPVSTGAESPPTPPPLTATVSGRALPEPSARTGSLRKLAERLRAPGGRVEDPCVTPSPTGTGCARTALTPFFASLDALSSRTASGPTVVEAFGNSLIAGDRIVDIVREDLGEAFGAAGRGVLLVDRMAPYGGRARTGYSQGGWQPRTLGELRAPPLPFGITGVYHVATAAKARGRFKLEGETGGTLWWLDAPRGGALTVSSDGKVLARTEPAGDGASRATSFEVPPGAKWLDVVAEGRGAVVQGVVLQHQRPGIVLDMLGVPSADAGLYARLGDDPLRAQLAQRAPALMLFFLGGNEAKRLEWKRTDPQKLRDDLKTLLRRAREAAPASACLVVGPIDAVQDKSVKGKPMSQRPFLEAVVTAEREVSHAEGCAFVDLYAAMGGEGSLVRFHGAGLVHDDLVHPKGRGLDLLGHLVSEALLRAWVEAPPSGALASNSLEAMK